MKIKEELDDDLQRYKPCIRWLFNARDRPDEFSTKHQLQRAFDDTELTDVRRLANVGTPSTSDDSVCFGREYAPTPRTMVNGEGHQVSSPDYSPDHDVCGRNCWLGLWKPKLDDNEQQGNSGCLLLLLFTQVFNLPLPVCDTVEQTETVRHNILQRVLSFLDPHVNGKKETIMPQYILQPGEEITAAADGQRLVLNAAKSAWVFHPDGSLVKESDVAPAALPTPTIPDTPQIPQQTTPPIDTPATAAPTNATAAPAPPTSAMPPTPAGLPTGTPTNSPVTMLPESTPAQSTPITPPVTTTAQAPSGPIATETPSVIDIDAIQVVYEKIMILMGQLLGIAIDNVSNLPGDPTPPPTSTPTVIKPTEDEGEVDTILLQQFQQLKQSNWVFSKPDGTQDTLVRKTFQKMFMTRSVSIATIRQIAELSGAPHTGWGLDKFRATASRVIGGILFPTKA